MKRMDKEHAHLSMSAETEQVAAEDIRSLTNTNDTNNTITIANNTRMIAKSVTIA